jgi:hypothetical protein
MQFLRRSVSKSKKALAYYVIAKHSSFVTLNPGANVLHKI